MSSLYGKVNSLYSILNVQGLMFYYISITVVQKGCNELSASVIPNIFIVIDELNIFSPDLVLFYISNWNIKTEVFVFIFVST